MKILLLGGKGFVGSALTKLYPHNFVIADKNNIPPIDLTGDISGVFTRDIDVVIHLADINPHSKCAISMDAYDFYNNNVLSTLNVIKCLKQFKIKHIIYLSTSHVYGCGLDFGESSPLNPPNYYVDTKICCENMIRDYCKDSNTVYQILRVSSVSGALNDKFRTKSICAEDHLIANLIKNNINEGKTVIYNPGIIRDYIHIKDLCKCINACVVSDKSGVYNVGSGVATSVRILTSTIQKQMGYINTIYRNSQVKMLLNTISNNLFLATFDVSLDYTLDDIIKDTISFYQK